jgi:hypothetical protein
VRAAEREARWRLLNFVPERDLFPRLERRLRLRLAPPAAEHGLPFPHTLWSVPCPALARGARQDLSAWFRGFHPRLAEDAALEGVTLKRPFMLSQTSGAGHVFVLVEGRFTRPIWFLGDGVVAYNSNAGVFAVQPGFIPERQPWTPPEPTSTGAPNTASAPETRVWLPADAWFFSLDGNRFPHFVEILAERELEAEARENAAEFLEETPQEREIHAFWGVLARVLGDVHAELRPAKNARNAEICLKWRSKSKSSP